MAANQKPDERGYLNILVVKPEEIIPTLKILRLVHTSLDGTIDIQDELCIFQDDNRIQFNARKILKEIILYFPNH